jgi:photosystem II stability/assembly factor-like uncharacterized protein
MAWGKGDKVYEVPSWINDDGSVWYKHLHSLKSSGDTIWAVGSEQLLRSPDGGATWTNHITPQLNRGLNTPERVFAINQNSAWILLLAHRAMNNCFYTEDGGTTWTEKRLPLLIHPQDLFFWDENRGWIISDDGDIPADDSMIHITRDGGSSWESLPLDIKGAAKRLKFFMPDRGLLIQHTTNYARTQTICNLLLTKDGGYSWRVLRSFNRLLTDLCILDDQRFFVVGEGGFIASTVDGGASWKRTYTRTRDAFNVIDFNAFGRGIAGGDFGLLMTTVDHGTRWLRRHGDEELDNIVGLCTTTEIDRAIVATTTAIFSLRFSER